MTSDPDRLSVEPNDRELYKKVGEELPLFKSKGRKEQFLFAAAFGFSNNIHVPLKAKDGFFLKKDLKMDDEALINAIALHDVDNVEILSNKSEIYKIVEEYAHAGIKLLVEEINSIEFGTFWKQFERDMHQSHEENFRPKKHA